MRRSSLLVFIFLVGVALGARFWYAYTTPESALVRYADRMAVLEGAVADDPDERASSVRVTVDTAFINGAEVSGKALVALPRDSAVAYGDRVVLRGVLERPEAFETASGRLFDYPGYLRVRGISVVMQRATLLERAPGAWSLRGALFSLKHWFEKSLERVVPEPQASLLEGILLGERGGFTKELLQAFVLVGLIHVVVLSGSNISIVAEAVFRALSLLPRTATYMAGALVMLLFVLMTGAGAAGVRALIMAGVALIARYLRRPAAALRALVLAATLMLLWNPLLLTDSGFVLSIVATFGLITLGNYIESKITIIPAWGLFDMRSIVATTLAVEAAILPALLYFSGTFALLSLPVNALVLPLVPLIMFTGFVAGVVGMVSPLLALVPATIADLLLRAVIFLAETTAGLPFAAATVGEFPLWLLVLVYMPIVAWSMLLYRQTAARAPAN